MRRKERSEDYRYFPEPDLVPIILTQEYIDEIRKTLPELPYEKNKRYVEELQLSPYSASILTSEKRLADYFEEGLRHTANAKSLCNWLTVEFVGRLKDSGKDLLSLGIPALQIAKLVNLIDKGTITGKIAKCVADEMVAHPEKGCESIIAANPDYQPVHDSSAIAQLVDQILRENPQSIVDFKAGKGRAFEFLVGQVMKLSRGKASPAVVNELLREKLEKI